MIDQWQTTINYSAYFQACAVRHCTYDSVQRHNFAYLIAIILGIFGGLVKVLRFVVPLVVQVYRKIRTRAGGHEPVWQQTTTFFHTYNLFYEVNSDEFQLRIQRQLTRFYLVILMLVLTTIFLLSALPELQKIETIRSPSLAAYHQLQVTRNLQCDCSQLAIPYSAILHLKSPTLHEVCSSDFVSDNWILHLFVPGIDLMVRSPVLTADLRTLFRTCRSIMSAHSIVLPTIARLPHINFNFSLRSAN